MTVSLGRAHHLVVLLRGPGFRRLLGVRLFAQLGDGVFQASLAGAVLFNPERQAHAADIAAGFAVLLLPYSIIGPFAGVLLDRWWRQRVLVWANVLRALCVLGIAAEIAAGVHGDPFYASALVVLSISRFFLAGLSASLPHVVGSEELVTANAVATTLGGLATTAGGAAAIGVRLLTGSGSDTSYAVMAACALLPYLLAAGVATGFARSVLGPDDVERDNRETLGEIARGLHAGARHLHSRRAALLALAAIGVHRLCYGLFAVSTLLLYRNYFGDHGVVRAGLAGLAQFVVFAAIGGGVAALITPPITRRIGFVGWAGGLLAASGIFEIALVMPFQLPLLLVSGFVLGCTAQGLKICVDTTIQSTVADEFRGRVFAIYDTLFNLALVAAAVLTAIALPDDGHAPAAVLVLGVIYLGTAIGYLRLAPRGVTTPPAVVATSA